MLPHEIWRRLDDNCQENNFWDQSLAFKTPLDKMKLASLFLDFIHVEHYNKTNPWH
jgi:hypothetical protein